MTFLFVSFIAGMLTVLAPCILPLLPVVIGSSASGRSRWTPYVVVGSLAVSIILFTYLLKASTVFIMVPPEVWTYLSGGILVLFGLTLVFPKLWEMLPFVSNLSIGSNKLVGAGYQRKSFLGDALIGAALGPVFSTCSPTYFVILASVLPVSFALGTVYILAYVVGLSIVLLAIAILGQRFTDRLAKISDSHGSFKHIIGVLFIILGILIATGYEKKLETAILDSGYFDVTKVEHILLQKIQEPEPTEENSLIPVEDDKISSKQTSPYKEITNPSGFVNTEGITLGELVGKKVILIDFLTYSCINCQRTFPYLNSWYEKYKDQGLEIVGIHTPEFAFEKDINNVREAMKNFGIKHPIVLDNDYATWRAYGNNFWPRKYLIDINGNIVYDHIGEGDYDITELKIVEFLKERALKLSMDVPELGKNLAVSTIPEVEVSAQSPETYFGASRNEYLRNGRSGVSGVQTFSPPNVFLKNYLYLGGTWNIGSEYAESVEDSTVVYKYNAKEVYIVAEADEIINMEVWQDGKIVGASGGEDVVNNFIQVKDSRLYKVIKNTQKGEHVLELRIKDKGLRLYAFTFG